MRDAEEELYYIPRPLRSQFQCTTWRLFSLFAWTERTDRSTSHQISSSSNSREPGVLFCRRPPLPSCLTITNARSHTFAIIHHLSIYCWFRTGRTNQGQIRNEALSLYIWRKARRISTEVSRLNLTARPDRFRTCGFWFEPPALVV